MGLIKGLFWFLINIPTLGIPYLISRRKPGNRQTDNSEPQFSIHFGINPFVSRKDVQRACKDLALPPQSVNRLIGNRQGIRFVFDANNAVKMAQYVNDGLFEYLGPIVDERHDDWIDSDMLLMVAKKAG